MNKKMQTTKTQTIKTLSVAFMLMAVAFPVQALTDPGSGQSTEQVITSTPVAWVTNRSVARNAGIAYSKLNLFDSITNLDILDKTIHSKDIHNNSIKSKDIKDHTIESRDLKRGSIKSGQIKDESILAKDIATGAVTTDEILNGTIIGADLAADIDIITTGDIKADNITANGNFAVVGISTFSGLIYAHGGINMDGGTIIDSTGNVSINDTLYVTGTTTIDNNFNVNGNTILGNTDTDATTINGSLTANDGITVDNTIWNNDVMTTANAADFTIDTTSGGDIFLNPTSDVIVAGRLLPSVDDNYNLGDPSARWENGYFSNTVNIGSTLVLSDNSIQDTNGNLQLGADNDGNNLLTISSDATDLTLGTTDGANLTIDTDGSFVIADAMTVNNTVNVIGLATLETVDINGGNIDGTNIGATTAGTGAFTTLSTTGTASLNDTTVGGGYGSTGVTIADTGNIQTNGTLTVDGLADIGGIITDSNDDIITIGDGSDDTITLDGATDVDGNLTGTGTLGTSSSRWSSIYADNINFDGTLNSTNFDSADNGIVSFGDGEVVGITVGSGNNDNVTINGAAVDINGQVWSISNVGVAAFVSVTSGGNDVLTDTTGSVDTTNILNNTISGTDLATDISFTTTGNVRVNDLRSDGDTILGSSGGGDIVTINGDTTTFNGDIDMNGGDITDAGTITGNINANNGVSSSITSGTCTLNFTNGILTSTAGTCP